MCVVLRRVCQMQIQYRCTAVVSNVVHAIVRYCVSTVGLWFNGPLCLRCINKAVRTKIVISPIIHFGIDNVFSCWQCCNGNVKTILGECTLSTPRITTGQEQAGTYILHIVNSIGKSNCHFASCRIVARSRCYGSYSCTYRCNISILIDCCNIRIGTAPCYDHFI